MGRQIIQQPNGNYAIWSSIVDDFIWLDLKKRDVYLVFAMEAVRGGFKDLEEVNCVLFPSDWESAMKIRKELHGDNEDFRESPWDAPEVEPDPPTFFSVSKDEERLSHEDPAEAVGEMMDGMTYKEIEELPDKITVYAWRRTKMGDEVNHLGILEPIYENLDDEYGDPDGEMGGSEYPKEVVLAAMLLVDAIHKTYTPWTCTVCGEEEFDIAEQKKEILEDRDAD